MSKSIFITGASTGLGRASAQLFAERGFRVFATLRDPSRAEGLTHKNISLLELDVTRAEQIASASAVALKEGPIDVVFNNAGYGLAGPFEGATDEQLVKQIHTNLLGVLRVTQAFLPAFRERRAGTFITTTSIGGHVTLPFNSVYHATKFGLEGWSESLAFELSKFGIRVKTVAPGGILTDFAGRSLVMTEHAAYGTLMQKVLAKFMDPARASSYSTAEQIAEVVYEAATDELDKVTYIAGTDAKGMFAARAESGAEASRNQIDRMFFGDL
jgi:NAD(P)-dependent dehydrogenase (short-subunit alcohol dehydrogenase family)